VTGPLDIDAHAAKERMTAGILDRMRATEAEGLLLGMSGGVDSSVLAALCTNAVRAQQVHARHLFDRYSSPRLRACARAVAERLGIDYREESITSAMQARGLYAVPGVRVTSLAGWLNRLLYSLYQRATGETPFLSTLKSPQIPPAGWHHSILSQAENGMNARHRYRREQLEALARERNWLLLGAANRSEWLIGWFVKGGIDDLPFQPLLGLYKTQVRQLAASLDLPACVLANRPSPDMLPGITDEFAIGLDYLRLDLILEYLMGDLPGETLADYSIHREPIEYVRDLMQSSMWKRRSD
jgi:NAD+ synthase